MSLARERVRTEKLILYCAKNTFFDNTVFIVEDEADEILSFSRLPGDLAKIRFTYSGATDMIPLIYISTFFLLIFKINLGPFDEIWI